VDYYDNLYDVDDDIAEEWERSIAVSKWSRKSPWLRNRRKSKALKKPKINSKRFINFREYNRNLCRFGVMYVVHPASHLPSPPKNYFIGSDNSSSSFSS